MYDLSLLVSIKFLVISDDFTLIMRLQKNKFYGRKVMNMLNLEELYL